MSADRTLCPLPIDPTPTGEMLDGRIALAIRNLQRVQTRLNATLDGLTGTERIAAARALNAYGTPLIVALEHVAKIAPDAA